ncbi:META domain-containing protein [Persicobacter sp. CCB-QB2]|uniref:META domain-containing protein n=1 Tax=Persicobacter sp. CCB-QB2 TaxID=1561025 RepID=UPI0009E3B57E|nr:META domain-containing protein [Persicobacter sp. CCB-QB2]
MMRNFLMLMMLGVVMMACTTGKQSKSAEAPALEGEWVMVAFKGEDADKLETVPPVPLIFREGNKFQVRPANSVSGPYELKGAEIKFGMGPSTMMAQPPEEVIFLKNWYKINQLEMKKGKLVLTNEEESVEMIFEKQ